MMVLVNGVPICMVQYANGILDKEARRTLDHSEVCNRHEVIAASNGDIPDGVIMLTVRCRCGCGEGFPAFVPAMRTTADSILTGILVGYEMTQDSNWLEDEPKDALGVPLTVGKRRLI